MDNTLPSAINTLDRVMSAAGWHSNHNRLFEAVPHMSQQLNASDMIKTLENLGVPLTQQDCSLDLVREGDCPALFVREDGTISAILDAKDAQLLTCSVAEDKPIWQAASEGRGRLIRLERFDSGIETEITLGFSHICSEFSGISPWLISASFMSNLAGLATPLLIMVVYDRVIPSGSVDLVLSLVVAVLLVLAADCGFRFARSSAVAYMGRHAEHQMGLALFRKLLALPIDQIQKSDVEQQLARFRQFESLRDIFSGQVLTTLLDLPFILIFLAVLFVLCPPVAWLVICLILVFALAITQNLPKLKKLNAQAAEAKTQLQSHIFEATEKQHAIQTLGLVQHWKEKNAALVKQAAQAARKAGGRSLVSQFIGQGLMAVAGVGAVVISAMSAIEGDITFGALIAVMALVWKVLTPLQALYSNAPQILSFLSSKRQSDRVLALSEEVVRGIGQSHQKAFEGQISFSGVTHRYDVASAPVLSQVSLDIQAGEFVLLCGDSNGGKTSLLDLICGFRQPSIGSIQLDGVDVRQIAVDDLRRAITYEQSQSQLFYGTLYQNFRLASPDISEQEVVGILRTMDILEEVEKFPNSIHTRLSETFRATLPSSTLSALALARSIGREGPVLLLNEPTTGLDQSRKIALAEKLSHLKGSKTILVATSDQRLIELGDRFVYLDQGRVIANDTGLAGRKKLAALQRKSGGN
ncbi:peptidase domain-containing ABC transporter [Roseovarius aestuarii]|uniref:Toxin RTX-I translocation ATP-binding protein n=1 Tax=Roseovarius aestuarii TaxID=475083 RepID=A0A1X7BM47_9RHOB|nr:ABC transporter transmembrane domain-containing protein [Roseovarius aestuarii]SMC10688.1 Toxin RTX-I translocation ATP-binding protein [Roseovarius aestuarii]